jgi:plasmid stabilization system protein ParE
VKRIILSEEARARLLEISSFIGERSEPAAKRIVARLAARIRELPHNPRLGRVVPEADDVDVRELIESGYRIMYWLRDDDAIEILTVIHGRQQVPDFDDDP